MDYTYILLVFFVTGIIMTNDLSVNASPVRVKRGCSSFLDPTCKFNVVFHRCK